MMRNAIPVAIVVGLLLAPTTNARAADRTFPAGSLIIPMDLPYQSRGMFQAYGLIYQLARHGIHVHWVIDPNKTWHAAPCNTVNDLCTWDCAIEGSNVKCPYPTASPDFAATTNVLWDDLGSAARGSALGMHRYRGGPFVIDAADRNAALAIIDIWNDQTKWATNPWAKRTVFNKVSVHEATAAFTGNSAREIIAAPSIAVFSDGNEDVATGYLRAAGIPQSSGAEFPSQTCGASNCGPGTTNPDMLTPTAIAGDLGTCDQPNLDHKNGALFKADGTPAYCQIMSMHWDVNARETVECAGGGCPATQGECTAGTKFTFNGHEVVAEVRAFLAYPVHFFAECQAVNAYENTVPNPAWPFLDDPGRDGHFLTTPGTPPACPCSDGNYECTQNDTLCGQGLSCCLPKTNTWKNLPGFEVATQPSSASIKVLRPDIPYNQFDGAFATTNGSEPAYNLSAYLGSVYKNNRQVTLLTGANGPGDQDVWMSGYLDGCSDIILKDGTLRNAAGCEGKISYLGGHKYSTTSIPVTSGSTSQGTRLFLNALFEAQCATAGPIDPGDVDSDGDGVTDVNDPYPTDPMRCGDTDTDACDDCSTGMFDLANDCDGAGLQPGQESGCCQTGSDPRSIMLGLGIIGLALRRRRR